MTDITELFKIQIDVQVVLALLLFGAMIKHLKMFEKVSNDLIPVLCYCVAFIIEIFQAWPIKPDNFLNVIIVSLVSACTAVGLHKTGKNIFVNGSFIESITKFFGSDDNMDNKNS